MARAPRPPKEEPAAPAEPDALDNAPPPRENPHLFGHQAAVARIAQDFSTNPPQGLLLEGPRGVGKATLGFHLARALLASVPGAPLPADLAVDPASRAARQVTAGTHPGLLHLMRPWDFKDKRFKRDIAVDDVRRIVSFLGSTAADGGWRVVIVDAVDDLNVSGANALLKSLEEPPPRAVFVLIAHASARVLPTIRSRCRTVRLRALPEEDVKAALSALDADPRLALLADGSVRRALVLAEAGADAVERARRMLSPEAMRDLRQHHALADIAAAKRGELFPVVTDLVLEAMAARVRAGAGRLPLSVLDAYAETYLSATADRRRIEAFNLDRKEVVLDLCARLAAADRAAQRAS
jgi:DNA polymerase-3 subunit delta'